MPRRLGLALACLLPDKGAGNVQTSSDRRRQPGLRRRLGHARPVTGHAAHRHDGRRYSANHWPARPGLRGLPLRRLHDLRRPGELGPLQGRHHRRHQAWPRHRMVGRRRRSQALDLQAAPGREVPRRHRFRRRCSGVESREDPERQVTAIRSQAGGAGPRPRADVGRMEGGRQVHGGAHHPGRELAVSLRHVLHLLFESDTVGEARQGLGEVRAATRRHRAVQGRSRGAARAARAVALRRLLGQGARAEARQGAAVSHARGRHPHGGAAGRARSTGSRCRRPTPSRG